MEKPLLNDPEIFPNENVLTSVLGNSFRLYKQMLNEISTKEFALNAEWRYYTDGKSWLYKIASGKKTIIWLSIWERFFKCTLYFHEKYSFEIEALPITTELKENFTNGKTYGKLKALTIDVKSVDDLKQVLIAVKLKKKLK